MSDGPTAPTERPKARRKRIVESVYTERIERPTPASAPPSPAPLSRPTPSRAPYVSPPTETVKLSSRRSRRGDTAASSAGGPSQDYSTDIQPITTQAVERKEKFTVNQRVLDIADKVTELGDAQKIQCFGCIEDELKRIKAVDEYLEQRERGETEALPPDDLEKLQTPVICMYYNPAERGLIKGVRMSDLNYGRCANCMIHGRGCWWPTESLTTPSDPADPSTAAAGSSTAISAPAPELGHVLDEETNAKRSKRIEKRRAAEPVEPKKPKKRAGSGRESASASRSVGPTLIVKRESSTPSTTVRRAAGPSMQSLGALMVQPTHEVIDLSEVLDLNEPMDMDALDANGHQEDVEPVDTHQSEANESIIAEEPIQPNEPIPFDEPIQSNEPIKQTVKPEPTAQEPESKPLPTDSSTKQPVTAPIDDGSPSAETNAALVRALMFMQNDDYDDDEGMMEFPIAEDAPVANASRVDDAPEAGVVAAAQTVEHVQDPAVNAPTEDAPLEDASEEDATFTMRAPVGEGVSEEGTDAEEEAKRVENEEGEQQSGLGLIVNEGQAAAASDAPIDAPATTTEAPIVENQNEGTEPQANETESHANEPEPLAHANEAPTIPDAVAPFDEGPADPPIEDQYSFLMQSGEEDNAVAEEEMAMNEDYGDDDVDMEHSGEEQEGEEQGGDEQRGEKQEGEKIGGEDQVVASQDNQNATTPNVKEDQVEAPAETIEEVQPEEAARDAQPEEATQGQVLGPGETNSELVQESREAILEQIQEPEETFQAQAQEPKETIQDQVQEPEEPMHEQVQQPEETIHEQVPGSEAIEGQVQEPEETIQEQVQAPDEAVVDQVQEPAAERVQEKELIEEHVSEKGPTNESVLEQPAERIVQEEIAVDVEPDQEMMQEPIEVPETERAQKDVQEVHAPDVEDAPDVTMKHEIAEKAPESPPVDCVPETQRDPAAITVETVDATEPDVDLHKDDGDEPEITVLGESKPAAAVSAGRTRPARSARAKSSKSSTNRNRKTPFPASDSATVDPTTYRLTQKWIDRLSYFPEPNIVVVQTSVPLRYDNTNLMSLDLAGVNKVFRKCTGCTLRECECAPLPVSEEQQNSEHAQYRQNTIVDSAGCLTCRICGVVCSFTLDPPIYGEFAALPSARALDEMRLLPEDWDTRSELDGFDGRDEEEASDGEFANGNGQPAHTDPTFIQSNRCSGCILRKSLCIALPAGEGRAGGCVKCQECNVACSFGVATPQADGKTIVWADADSTKAGGRAPPAEPKRASNYTTSKRRVLAAASDDEGMEVDE